jgi:hypothetical protein
MRYLDKREITLPYSSFRIVLSTSKSVWLRISSATSVEHDPTGAMLIFTLKSNTMYTF